VRSVKPADEIDPDHAQWSAIVAAVEHAQERLLSAVERMEIPAQWYAVLHALLHAADYRLLMSQLARQTSFTSGGFTKLADRMARAGLIDRRSSGGDRRVVYATLTRAGYLAAGAAERAYIAALRSDVLNVLSAEQLETLATLLRPLDEHSFAPEIEPEAAIELPEDDDEDDHFDVPRISRRLNLGQTDSA